MGILQNSHGDLVKLPWGFEQLPMGVLRVLLGRIFLPCEITLELVWWLTRFVAMLVSKLRGDTLSNLRFPS
jgi:hypothetical protein